MSKRDVIVRTGVDVQVLSARLSTRVPFASGDIYFDAAVTCGDIVGRNEHHVSIGENIFRDRIHFEAVHIRPVADVFVKETIRVETGQMDGEIIG